MSTLYLFRHGKAGSRDDYDRLSPIGCSQAHRLGEHLAAQRVSFSAFYTGGLRRQRETAEAVRSAHPLMPEPIVDERWNEFDHHALLHRYIAPERIEPALTDSQAFQHLLDEALDAWSRDGGWAAFTADALAALQDVTDRLPRGRDAVVVSSGFRQTKICSVSPGPMM